MREDEQTDLIAFGCFRPAFLQDGLAISYHLIIYRSGRRIRMSASNEIERKVGLVRGRGRVGGAIDMHSYVPPYIYGAHDRMCGHLCMTFESRCDAHCLRCVQNTGVTC